MNQPTSPRALRLAIAVIALGGLAFLGWYFGIRRERDDRQFTPFAFNWGNSGPEQVLPGFDEGSVEILSAGDKVAFVICTDFKGDVGDTRQLRNDGRLAAGTGPSRRSVEWSVKSFDGKSGMLVINEQSFDLSKGALFVASTQGEQTRVRQFDKDLAAFTVKPQQYGKVFEDVTAFIRSDPDVSAFLKAAPIPATPIHFVTVGLPRGEKSAEGKWSPTHDEIYEVLKDLPCFAKGYYDLKSKSLTAANHNTVDYGSYRDFSFSFCPTADCDLGDVAKALLQFGGDQSKPVATVSLASFTPIPDEQFANLKAELAQAKGIDWKNSDANRFALDEAGGAKFEEIRAAYKKAGIALAGE